MKILVTGASGLVGRLAVARASARHDVVGLSRSQLDVRDERAVGRTLSEFRPGAVLHCAAYTDVDGAESDPAKAMEVNAFAAGRVAAAAEAVGAIILYVSTDYVFDGARRTPYAEEEPPAPLSGYGRSKLEGERLVARACPERFVIVRTGWLYGPGKGFVDWARSRLVEGRELPLVEDQVGSPTSARELAGAMLTLVETDRRGLFHFANRGETSWLGLGLAIAEELALDSSRIRPIRAEELSRPAPRPRYSALSAARYERATGERIPSWREALRDYLIGPSVDWR